MTGDFRTHQTSTGWIITEATIGPLFVLCRMRAQAALMWPGEGQGAGAIPLMQLCQTREELRNAFDMVIANAYKEIS